MTPRGYRVQFYDQDDKMFGEPFEMPSLPYPGLVIFHEGGGWEITAMAVDAVHPRSMAAREGGPLGVEAIVVPASGIHRD